MIPSEETDVDPDEAVNTFVAMKINGREIANTVHTARTIARFQEKPLQMDHIEMVLGVWNKFDESLKKSKMSASMEKGALLLPRRTNSIIEEDSTGTFES